MKWIDLELSRVAEIEKQADEVIRTYETLTKQLAQPRKGINAAQVTQAIKVLKAAMVARVVSLEAFYRENDLDSRAARFESSRLKIKRALKESGVTPQEFASLAAAISVPTPGHHAATPDSARPADQRLGLNLSALSASAARTGTVTLKIHMTAAEFEELRARRQAMRTVKKGQGRMAWEASGQSPRANPAAEGMYTYHEVPYVDSSPRGDGPAMRFGLPPSPRVLPSSDINRGEPYRSNNPEVHARTSRFSSAINEATGGAKAINPAKPFNAISGRTNVSNNLAKVKPFGSV